MRLINWIIQIYDIEQLNEKKYRKTFAKSPTPIETHPQPQTTLKTESITVCPQKHKKVEIKLSKANPNSHLTQSNIPTSISLIDIKKNRINKHLAIEFLIMLEYLSLACTPVYEFCCYVPQTYS
jgi:hypothetical protein